MHSVQAWQAAPTQEDQGDDDQGTAATPACLLGMLLRMAYKAKKYHSGDGSAKWEAIEIKGKESSDGVGAPE